MLIQRQTQHQLLGGFDALSHFLYDQYAHDQLFMLDSAHGPAVDRQKNMLGLFPQFDVTLAGDQLQVTAVNSAIYDHVVAQLADFYDASRAAYVLPETERFAAVFRHIQAGLQAQQADSTPVPALSQGLVGYFSYEYLHHIERIPRANQPFGALPDVHLTYYATILHFDDDTGRLTAFDNCLDEASAQHGDLLARLAQYQPVPPKPLFTSGSDDCGRFNVRVNKADYLAKVARAKDYIVAGDIFQVQLGFRFEAALTVDAVAVYQALRAQNPSPYMFLWERTGTALIGNSPELQLKIEGSDMMIRPIAGTSKGKGSTPAEREALVRNLATSDKERAEHVMLVDLARNDIGRVAQIGSVTVDELMRIEAYSNVFHMTSTVSGQLLPEVDSLTAFEDTFPAGTLTGAPKVRAMAIIQELETDERGPYGGAFGFFDFNGNINSAITIRTIVAQPNRVSFQASAGIVADSLPESEFQEVFFKTQTLRKMLNGYADHCQ